MPISGYPHLRQRQIKFITILKLDTNNNTQEKYINYSHSIVAGGLPETSYTTLDIPSTSLIMRFET